METIAIEVGSERVSCSLHGQPGEALLALGHGAGGTRHTPFLVRLAEALAIDGRSVLLFNFPYSEARRRLPDKPALLEATVDAVARCARERLGARRVALGGKSMGGRMCSQAAASGTPAEALVFLGYPLHPPGQFERLRDAHLMELRAPLLFVQGTRDAFARWDLLQDVLARLHGRATLHVIDQGDHSFALPRRAGRTPAEVEREIAAAVSDWLGARGL